MSTEKINLLLKTLQQAEFLTTKSAIANNLIKRQNHIMSVSAGVLLNNKKILLIKRENEPDRGKWCFPGGKIEKNESYEEATLRELREETGFQFYLPNFHLFKISTIGKYLIISSIAKCKDVDFNKKPKSFVYENIENEQFSLEEIKDKRDEEFVPGIKELSVYALENYDKYI